MVDENGPHYFVAFQTPGPKWVPGVKYNEQPEFMNHVGYMNEMQENGQTVLSGPFMKKAGGLNGELEEGGMTIFKAADMEEATRIATDDPTVKSGMLNVEVKMFWVPFHT
ncbi:cytosolic protein [Luteibacter pinisoli]|uniref:Cytosolic protein n=1 Tax=Luteibacter pinisoli TaxID=2589080 RepID=A0A4Y5Z3F2_9GAMM|nr:YciI family protein [Luteibacter pinisoli]QDE39920.1 cytosolic protein [Luteibacter pinisoli]